MKPIYIDNSLLMYHRPINRHTLKAWRREWKLSQFRKLPILSRLVSPLVGVGATLPVLMGIYA